MRDLRGLLVFREVACSGGFSSAARQMNVTAAAVSRSIAKLEGELGVRLFNRTTSEFHPTPEGTALAAAINEGLDTLYNALEDFSVNHTSLSGKLRVSLTNSYGKFYVVPQLQRFMTDHPDIRLEVGFDDQRNNLIEAGFGVGICYGQPQSTYQ